MLEIGRCGDKVVMSGYVARVGEMEDVGSEGDGDDDSSKDVFCGEIVLLIRSSRNTPRSYRLS